LTPFSTIFYLKYWWSVLLMEAISYNIWKKPTNMLPITD